MPGSVASRSTRAAPQGTDSNARGSRIPTPRLRRRPMLRPTSTAYTPSSDSITSSMLRTPTEGATYSTDAVDFESSSRIRRWSDKLVQSGSRQRVTTAKPRRISLYKERRRSSQGVTLARSLVPAFITEPEEPELEEVIGREAEALAGESARCEDFSGLSVPNDDEGRLGTRVSLDARVYQPIDAKTDAGPSARYNAAATPSSHDSASPNLDPLEPTSNAKSKAIERGPIEASDNLQHTATHRVFNAESCARPASGRPVSTLERPTTHPEDANTPAHPRPALSVDTAWAQRGTRRTDLETTHFYITPSRHGQPSPVWRVSPAKKAYPISLPPAPRSRRARSFPASGPSVLHASLLQRLAETSEADVALHKEDARPDGLPSSNDSEASAATLHLLRQTSSESKPSVSQTIYEVEPIEAGTSSPPALPSSSAATSAIMLTAIRQQSTMSPRETPRMTSSASAPTRKELFAVDAKSFPEQSAEKKSVRRNEGKRAESEATATMRARALRRNRDSDGHNANGSFFEDDNYTGDSNPFINSASNGVRSFFRARTKSTSHAKPKRAAANGYNDHEPFTMAPSSKATDYSTTNGEAKRQRTTSLLAFARARAPPSSNPDDRSKPKTLMQRIRTQSRSRQRKPSINGNNGDSSHFALASPEQNSQTKSPAGPIIPSSSADEYRLPAFEHDHDGGESSSMLRHFDTRSSHSGLRREASSETSTPKESTYGTATILGHDSGASPRSQGKTSTTVPRIWMGSRNSYNSDTPASARFGSSMDSNRDLIRPTRFAEGSGASFSGASFRTAQSNTSPYVGSKALLSVPITTDEMAERDDQARAADAADDDALQRMGSNRFSSPLADLIENLERRKSSSASSRDVKHSRTASTPRSRGSLRSVAANLTPTSLRFPSIEAQRGQTFDEDERHRSEIDDDQKTPKDKRHTFGDAMSTSNTFSQDDATSQPLTASGSAAPTLGHIPLDRSMSEIETSLAAVEAALQRNRTEGSLDPNALRPYIYTSRHHPDVSALSLQALNGSFAALDEAAAMTRQDATLSANDESDVEQLAHVTLPPEQELAIQDAIRQVRRALSSSHLPQIPNEDDSTASKSPRDSAKDGVQASLPTEEDGQLEVLADQTPIPAAGRTFDSENTPMRSARFRQESMQDVEQAYRRMLELVSNAAGLDMPSPSLARLLPRHLSQQQLSPLARSLDIPSDNAAASSRGSPASRRSQLLGVSLGSNSKVDPARDSTQSQPTQQPLPTTLTRSARQQLLRDSDKISRVTSTDREVAVEDEAGTPVARVNSGADPTTAPRSGSAVPSRSSLIASGQDDSNLRKEQLSPPPVFASNRLSGASFESASVARPGPMPVPMDQQSLAVEDPILQSNGTGRESYTSHFSPTTSTIGPLSPESASVPISAPRSAAVSPALSAVRTSANQDWRSRTAGVNRAPGGAANLLQYRGVTSPDGNNYPRLPSSQSMSMSIDGHKQGLATTATQATLIAAQRRHTLERNSLLDTLEQARTEVSEARTQNVQLQTALHQEVTRVLELERQLERQHDREAQLEDRLQQLELELQSVHGKQSGLKGRSYMPDGHAAQGGDHQQSRTYDSATTDGSRLYGGETAQQNRFASQSSVAFPTLGSNTQREANVYEAAPQTRLLQFLRPTDSPPLPEAGESTGRTRKSRSLHSRASDLELSLGANEANWSLDDEQLPEDIAAREAASSHGHTDRSQAAAPAPVPEVPSTVPRTTSGLMSRLPLPRVVRRQVSGRFNKGSFGSNGATPERKVSGQAANSATPIYGSSAYSSPESGKAARIASTSSSMISAGPLPRYQQAPASGSRIPSLVSSKMSGVGAADKRNFSTASRFTSTTGGDTSYSAQTSSPLGEFVPTFPSNGQQQAPNMTIAALKRQQRGASGLGDVSSSSLRGTGGYYDPRRPANYNPVDTSVLDALETDESYGQ